MRTKIRVFQGSRLSVRHDLLRYAKAREVTSIYAIEGRHVTGSKKNKTKRAFDSIVSRYGSPAVPRFFCRGAITSKRLTRDSGSARNDFFWIWIWPSAAKNPLSGGRSTCVFSLPKMIFCRAASRDVFLG